MQRLFIVSFIDIFQASMVLVRLTDFNKTWNANIDRVYPKRKNNVKLQYCNFSSVSSL